MDVIVGSQCYRGVVNKYLVNEAEVMKYNGEHKS